MEVASGYWYLSDEVMGLVEKYKVLQGCKVFPLDAFIKARMVNLLKTCDES